MQPYFFPYIGYFQLVSAVDKFIFYDDVNYIKGGWINRNQIISNNGKNYITIPVEKASSHKQINETKVKNDNSKKILKTIIQNYSKAPFFEPAFNLVESCLSFERFHYNLAEISSQTIKKVCEYLNLEKSFEVSSESYSESKELEKEDRITEICRYNKAEEYINLEGGKNIYKKESFKREGINLFFINNKFEEYDQGKPEFTPFLSIIDVLMFNSKEKVQEMLDNYDLH